MIPIIKRKWSDRHKILKLCELRDKGTTCIIIGTLFKFQELKPSILKELSDQLEIIPQAPRTHFVHESDSLVLEDELQRIKLVGDCIDVHEVVTGVVCALLGGVLASHSNESGVNETEFIAAVELMDSLAAAVSAVAPLDLMPSSKDPTGIMLPQKPFHYCLFPKAIEYKSFNRVTNPYECEIAGFTCLGTSGEPIKDIMRYSKLDNALEVMKKTLQWRNIAPTCPDTIPCTPCTDTDPFIIYNCPAIYFCGNSAEFATDLYEGENGQRTRLVPPSITHQWLKSSRRVYLFSRAIIAFKMGY
ncbi:hypothetical protein B5X24_HaOG205468 [Helicoverpa armigera]|nr:hypothetical protein B5X24_HaOG205468 [Helicoverpa armigera]